MATAEERLAKIKEKQAQLKAQEKKIITQEKAKERKLRTKRLIEIGGTAESILGRPFQDDDLQKFANFLKQQEARGKVLLGHAPAAGTGSGYHGGSRASDSG